MNERAETFFAGVMWSLEAFRNEDAGKAPPMDRGMHALLYQDRKPDPTRHLKEAERLLKMLRGETTPQPPGPNPRRVDGSEPELPAGLPSDFEQQAAAVAVNQTKAALIHSDRWNRLISTISIDRLAEQSGLPVEQFDPEMHHVVRAWARGSDVAMPAPLRIFLGELGVVT